MDFCITPQIYDKDRNIDYKAHAEAGFKGIDLQHFVNFSYKVLNCSSSQLTKFCKNELKRAKEANMHIHQLHSMWVWPPFEYDANEECRNKALKYYQMAIRAANMLECKYVAIHHRLPVEFDDPNLNELAYDGTLDFMKKLIPYARKYKVTLCLENLPFPQETFHVYKTVELIKKVNSKYCRMCLDTGHANVTEKDFYSSFMYAKNYIKIFHVHDNDGTKDSHLNPGKGNIDWNLFKKGLKEMGFNDMLSLETGIKATQNREEDIKKLKELKNYVEGLFNE